MSVASRAATTQVYANAEFVYVFMAESGRMPVESVWCERAISMTMPRAMAMGWTHRRSYPRYAPAKSEAVAEPAPSVWALCIQPGPDFEKYHRHRFRTPPLASSASSVFSLARATGSALVNIGRPRGTSDGGISFGEPGRFALNSVSLAQNVPG